MKFPSVATWKQIGWAAITAAITVVLVFTVAGLSSKAQLELAHRVDRNTQAVLCVLLIPPAERTDANVKQCVMHPHDP